MNQDKGVVITGSSGFIGSHLLPLLKRASEVQTIDSDIRKQDSLKSISPADVMYHLAGVMPQQGHDVQEVNVNGTRNILEACRLSDISNIVFASSASVYGIPDRIPVTEEHPRNPQNEYGRSKLEGERLCISYAEQHGLKYTILRLFNVYGPGQVGGFMIPSILNQLGSEKVKLRNTGYQRDFVFVTDVADAFLKAAPCRNGTFNVASGTGHTATDITERIIRIHSEMTGSPPKEAVYGEADDFNIVADISRIREQLGWSPKVGIDEGLRETVRWFLER